MRKLLFFSIATSLFLNAKAQIEVKSYESVVQKPSAEKREQVQFVPTKEISMLSGYNFAPERKAVTYTSLDNWTKSISFAANAVGDIDVDYGYCAYLFPDSLAAWYDEDLDASGSYSGKYPMFASIGMTFDPFSKSFDNYGINGMFAYKTNNNEDRFFLENDGSMTRLYGYRLDGFYVLVDYRLPKGYNPASPDTLRFHITHLGAYDLGADSNDFMAIQYGDEGDTYFCKALSPTLKYPSPIPVKGVGPVMKATNKIVKDYILTDEDTTVFAGQYLYPAEILIDLEYEEYIIPPGHVLSIVVQYIPGFEYAHVDTLTIPKAYVFEEETTFHAGDSLIIGDYIHYFEEETTFYVDDTLYGYDISYRHNDTIVKITWNSGLPENSQYIGREDFLNSLCVAAWNLDESTMDFMFDSKGYNSGLVENNVIRYKIPVTDNDKFFVQNSIYITGYYYIQPAFWLALSIGDNYVEKIVSVADYTNNPISRVYPNPATSQLTINLNEFGKASVTIYNVLGQIVLEELLQDISNRISIAELSSGLYFVKVNQNGRSHTVKISKE